MTSISRLQTKVRAHPYTFVAALVLVGFGLEVMLRRAEDWEYVYLPAGRLLIEGRDFYDPRVSPFPYPPASAALAAAFTTLPSFIQPLMWLFINGAALVSFWWCAWRAAGGGRLTWIQRPKVAGWRDAATDWREHAVLWLGMTIALRYVSDTLEHRQTDLLIAAFTAGAALAVVRGRWWLAATFCGIAAAVKATPALWAVYFVWRRRWWAVLLMVALAVGISLIPDLISHPPMGGTWLQRWLAVIVLPIATGSREIGPWHTAPIFNQSVAGTLYRLSARPPVILAAEAVILLAGFAAIAARGRGESCIPRPALECSVVNLLMLLLSPASSKPHFVVLLLPAYCVARLALIGRDRIAAFSLAGALLCSVLSHRTLVGEAVGGFAQWAGAITASALFLLVGCATPLARPARNSHSRTGPDARLRRATREQMRAGGRAPPGQPV